jgi:hypothetical protein
VELNECASVRAPGRGEPTVWGVAATDWWPGDKEAMKVGPEPS